MYISTYSVYSRIVIPYLLVSLTCFLVAGPLKKNVKAASSGPFDGEGSRSGATGESFKLTSPSVWRWEMVSTVGVVGVEKRLGGGFKYFFSPLLGEDAHFDEYFSDGLKPPTRRAPSPSLKLTYRWPLKIGRNCPQKEIFIFQPLIFRGELNFLLLSGSVYSRFYS